MLPNARGLEKVRQSHGNKGESLRAASSVADIWYSFEVRMPVTVLTQIADQNSNRVIFGSFSVISCSDH